MSDVLDGATALPSFPLPDDLLAKFVAAAKKDGLIDGQAPVQFLQSQAATTGSELSKFFATAGMQAGVVAAGSLASIATAMAAGPAALFFIGNLFDPTRSISIVLVNNLPTGLGFKADDIHLGTGHVESVPAVMDTKGTVTTANHVLGKGDITGLDGAGAGIFCFQKSTTLGIGYYGTEGGIHLVAEDDTLLPSGVYIGWRVPERGGNTCAVSITPYRDAKEFYEKRVDDGSARQTDQSTTTTALAHCAVSSIKDTSVSMVVLLDVPATS